MHELDDLLRPDIAAAAARDAAPRDLDGVLARGRTIRTRRRRTAVAVVCAVVLLSGGAVATARAGLDGPAPQPAGPRLTHAPHPRPAVDASRLVDDPRAAVVQVAVSPTDPDVRAVVWRLCGRRCTSSQIAVAVTGDGFATRSVLPVHGSGWADVTASDAGTFLVEGATYRPFLLRPDGSRVPVVASGAPAPLRSGELLSSVHRFADRWIGVDPVTGAAHFLPRTTDALRDLTLQPDGRLVAQRPPGGVIRPPTYLWSDDGGATWQRHQLSEEQQGSVLLPAASGRAGTWAVVHGADGATLFPLIAVERSTDSGRSWQHYGESDRPRAYVEQPVVLPDGRLLVMVDGWSDDHIGHRARPRGPYVSHGDDWSRFEPVRPSAADALGVPAGADLMVVGMSVREGAVTVYVSPAGAAGATVLAVDGETLAWSKVRGR